MNVRQALDAFEMAARVALIMRFAEDPDTVKKIESGLSEARTTTDDVILAIGGIEARQSWTLIQSYLL